MHTKQIGKNLHQVELCTGGIKQLICSYILCGETPVLVESGPTNSVPQLLSALQELDIKPMSVQYVAVTHVHLDHGGGAGTLLKSLPNAKVIVHPRGAPHLINPERLWPSSQAVLGYVSEVFGKPEPVPNGRIVTMTEGSISIGGDAELTVTETLGHASHNLSFQEPFNGGVFPGDTAGTYLPECGVVVPTTPPPFYLESALASLDKLIALQPTALYFSHFGKADTAVNRLKAYKVQLQLWADIAETGVKANKSLEQIRDSIVEADPVMTQIQDYVKDHPIYKKTVLENCVRGFIEYAKSKLAKGQS
ncbi:MAG: MBL fold metallo-hydrolase [Candidatus Bathyarchaeia archaeon]|jgi:glyoxylase-like metal-dependent hydrolase (beta-lactamase superfamily II)